MDMCPLDEAIAATLREVGELAERDRSGRAHDEVRSRMGYLHGLLRQLGDELGGLRRESAGTPEGRALWRRTTEDLRARRPGGLQAPAAALISGDLDLLRLVEYTSASIALVQERRSALRRARPPEQVG